MKANLRIGLLSLALLGAGCISSDRQHASDTADSADATADADDDGADGDDSDVSGCEGAAECADDDPCTVDSCGEDGVCLHQAAPGCERCDAPADCHGQGDECATPHCDAGYCTYTITDGCRSCDDTTVCGDGDACTVESCDGTCHYADLGCDDDDPCTTDACDPLAGCTHDDTCGPPTLALADAAEIAEGDTLIRVGSVSGPPSETFTASVDWGDGAGADPTPLNLEADGTFALDHVYAADGEYTLVVTAVDTHERSAHADLVVTVTNVAPTFLVDAPAPIEEGGQLTLTGAVTDPGADVTGAEVDWGDGAAAEPVTLDEGGAFTLTHRYDDDGVYTLTLSASDDDETAGVDLEIIVANAAPHFVPPSNRVVLEGTATTMHLPISDPGAADTFSGEVDYGLGTAPEPLVIEDHAIVLTLRYPDDGTWPVTLTLRDDDGGESVDAFVVAVTNVAPDVAGLAAQQLTEGDLFELDAAFTDPGADSWTAQVSFGDGSAIATPEVDGAARSVPLSHVWADDGTFIAFVSVADDDGGDDATTFVVAVANAPPSPAVGGDETLDEGGAFTRDAVALDPGAGDVLSGTVRWDAAEPEETLGIDVATRAYHLERSYPNQGIHDVTVTVRDDDGGTRSETFTLTVVNVPPTVDCGSHAVLAAGGRLERVCSFTDPGADSWSGSVAWGDGSDPEPLTLEGDGTFGIGHTFVAEATYAVVVTLDDGTEPGTASFDVAVGNAPPLVDAGLPATRDEGSPFVREGQAFDSSEGAFSATVDYGDGGGEEPLELTPNLRFTLDHAFAQDGVYNVIVRVTDPDDTVGSDVVAVTVRNVAPTVVAGGGASLNEGERLIRAVTVTDPGTLDVLSATVDYDDGDGPVALPLNSNGEATLDHVYTHDGAHTVTVTASDDGGGDGHASFVVQVANGAPVVSAGDDGASDEGASFERTISFTDAGADTWTASVDWGDGSPTVNIIDIYPGDPIALAHVYANDGQYAVIVGVSDGAASGTAGFTVSVANLPPVVSAGGDGSVDEGATFTRAGTVTDPGVHDALTATVDWGDGLGPLPLTLGAGGGFTLSHAFPNDGVFAVTVAASDGHASGSANFTVTVGNVAPVVSAGLPATLDEGKTFSRTVTFTDPGADTWTATVDWDDGAGPKPVAVGPGRTVALSHAFLDEDDVDVVIAVHDGVATGTAHLAVTVKNVAPTVEAGGDAGLSEGGTLTRVGTVTDPGPSDTFTATVDYGGGATALTITEQRTFSLTHTYPSQGDFPVTVRVTDDAGGVGTDTFVVKVSNTAPVVSPGADTELDEGATLTRTVSFSDSGADSWTATVDYGDGGGPQSAPVNQGARTVALSHAYLDDGDFEVVITVSDGTETGQGSFRVVAHNVLPIVTLGAAATMNEGAVWTRGGSFTDPGVLDPHSATVAWGDGTPPTSLALTPQGTFTLSHAFTDDGDFTVTVTVNDDDGGGLRTVAVHVDNVAPGLPETLGAVNLDVGEPWQRSVAFTDPGADTWSLTASYGDGPGSVGPLASRSFNVNHVYMTPGDYAASFVVSDDDGGSDTVGATVHVANVAPTVEAGSDRTVAEGSALTVTASFDDPGSEAHTATIAWLPNDVRAAAVDEPGQLVSGTYTYPDDGLHEVVVTVRDAYEGEGSDSLHVTVTNVAPVVDAGGDTTTDPLGWLRQSGSFGDPGADVWTVTANWGDGSEPQVVPHGADKSFSLEHQYAVSDDYTVVVTVSDGDGGTGSATFDVSATVSDCSQVPGATGKQWVGGALGNPTGWSVGSNWSPAGVPASGTDIFLCAGHVYYPVLSQASNVHTVRMAPTASIASAGRGLNVSGDLLGGAVTGTGAVTMSGAGATLSAQVPSLVVSGGVEATATITVSGDLTINDQASFGLANVTVGVRGNTTVWSSADGKGLVLDSAGDVLSAGANFNARAGSGTGQSVSSLTAGRLEVGGGFTQKGNTNGPISFFSTGTTVKFLAQVDQTVAFDDPGTTRARFADVEVSGPRTVTFGTDAAITGTLSVPGGATLAGDKKLYLTTALPVLGAGASYGLHTTQIVGDIVMHDDFIFAGDKQALTIDGGGALHVGAHSLEVGGPLTVRITANGGIGLHMNDSNGEVTVGGTALFTNVLATTPTEFLSPLQRGHLRLRGGLTVTGDQTALAAFAPAAGFITHIVGPSEKAQEVSFANTARDRFDTLVLEPGAWVRLLSDARVAGTLEADNAVRASVSGPYTLHAATLDAVGIDFEATRLWTSNLVRFDEATFSNQSSAADQLTIQADNLSATVHGLRFETVPTTGSYIYGIGGSSGGMSQAKLTVADSVPLHGLPWCHALGGFTITWGTTSDDTDADGLSDAGEHAAQSDPLDPDSDGDTFLDGTEVGVGTSPILATSVPFVLAAPTGYATGATPAAVAVGDLDDDGALDLGIANEGNDSVTVWFGEPAVPGTFGARIDLALPAGAAPQGIAFETLRGNPVFVVAETGNDEVSLIEGFTPERERGLNRAVVLPACAGPNAVVAGYVGGLTLNGFAASCGGSDQVRLYVPTYNVVQGTWSFPHSDHAVGAGPNDLVLGNFSTAVSPDLATSNGAGGTVTILRGTTFAPFATLDAADARGLAGFDLDQNGHDDVIVVLGATDQVDVRYNPGGSGSFTASLPRDVGVGARTVAVGDLDGNGWADIATAATDDDVVSLLLQPATTDGAKMLFPHTVPGLDGAGEYAVVLRDLNGDGKPDLIVVARALDEVVVALQVGADAGTP